MTLTYSHITGGTSAFRIEDFVFRFGIGRATPNVLKSKAWGRAPLE